MKMIRMFLLGFLSAVLIACGVKTNSAQTETPKLAPEEMQDTLLIVKTSSGLDRIVVRFSDGLNTCYLYDNISCVR
jgi:hypothetical protein